MARRTSTNHLSDSQSTTNISNQGALLDPYACLLPGKSLNDVPLRIDIILGLYRANRGTDEDIDMVANKIICLGQVLDEIEKTAEDAGWQRYFEWAKVSAVLKEVVACCRNLVEGTYTNDLHECVEALGRAGKKLKMVIKGVRRSSLEDALHGPPPFLKIGRETSTVTINGAEGPDSIASGNPTSIPGEIGAAHSIKGPTGQGRHLKPSKTKGKRIDEKMLVAIRDDPQNIYLSSPEWADKFRCARSTVTATRTWIIDCKPARDREQLSRGVRLRKKKSGRVHHRKADA